LFLELPGLETGLSALVHILVRHMAYSVYVCVCVCLCVCSEDQGWKQKLKLPAKDLRVKTAVNLVSFCLTAVSKLCTVYSNNMFTVNILLIFVFTHLIVTDN